MPAVRLPRARAQRVPGAAAQQVQVRVLQARRQEPPAVAQVLQARALNYRQAPRWSAKPT